MMRYVITVAMACLLGACSGIPPSKGSTCSTKSECEIQAYQKAY